MAGPFKATRFVLKIDGNPLSVVEGATRELEKDGGVEHYYGSQTGKHAIGGNRVTFSIRRWYKTDSGKGALLVTLFQNEQSFMLEELLTGVSGSTLTLSDCKIYRFRLVTGAPNDIVAEEASGEATAWDIAGITDD